MKKRLSFIFILAFIAALTLAGRGSALLSVDLYFENGTIYTVDEDDGIVEGLAVSNGTIVFAGSSADGRAFKKAAREVVDLDGKMLMPGMIDSHIHSAALDSFDITFLNAHDLDKTMAVIKEAIAAQPKRKNYFGFGYMATYFPGEEEVKGPRKERLDEICRDKPIVIYSFDGHSAWMNTKAFEYFGITKETESPPGGTITKDEDGELWGTLFDSAVAITKDFPMDAGKVKNGLKSYMAMLNSYGFTSIITPPADGFFPVPLESYRKMADDGELTMRVRAHTIVTPWRTKEDLNALMDAASKYDGGLVKVIGAKFFTDGVVDNRSAYLLEPYANDTSRGKPGWSQKDINEAVLEVNRTGMLAHFHSIGDAGARMALDASEYSQNKLGRSDFRNQITHLQLVAADDVKRFAKLRVIPIVNPYWHLKEPNYWESVEHAGLGERAEREYPLKSFFDSGATVAVASDYPVTIPPNPFHAIQTGVTRNRTFSDIGLPDITDTDDPEGLLWPEERATVTQMIRASTMGGAYAMLEDETTGSLEVGKSADMIVLDQNILEVDPLKIKNTRVLRTYFQGKLVYAAD